MRAIADIRATGAAWITETELESLCAEIERLREALKPFANVLKGHWSHQPDDTEIIAGRSEYDLRLCFRLGDFRKARAALEVE